VVVGRTVVGRAVAGPVDRGPDVERTDAEVLTTCVGGEVAGGLACAPVDAAVGRAMGAFAPVGAGAEPGVEVGPEGCAIAVLPASGAEPPQAPRKAESASTARSALTRMLR